MDPKLSVLTKLKDAWLDLIQKGLDHKETEFGADAQEAMSFLKGARELWAKEGPLASVLGKGAAKVSERDLPSKQIVINKAAELQQLFGPHLYYANHNRMITPYSYMIPPGEFYGANADLNAQAQYEQQVMQLTMHDGLRNYGAQILERMLNYGPNELDLVSHSQRALDEALIKGMGTLWTELYQWPGGEGYWVGSFYDTVDNLVLDPDANTWEDLKWIARRREWPVWELEDHMGVPRNTYKGYQEEKSYQAALSQTTRSTSPTGALEGMKSGEGETSSRIVVWEVYSKMGIGSELCEFYEDEEIEQLEQFGKFIRLMIPDRASGIPHPLNLTPETLMSSQEEALVEVSWPIPLWLDNQWPFVPISFHFNPDSVWPYSHLKPGMGWLKFLSWAMSLLLNKVEQDCGTWIAIWKGMKDKVMEEINKGGDKHILEISDISGKSVSDYVQFMQSPPFHQGIWDVVAAAWQNFERATGLDELLAGQATTQSRSATDIMVRNENSQARIKNMVAKTDKAFTRLARNEALCAHWFLGAEDVAPIVGPMAAEIWQMYVQSIPPEQFVREYDIRVEASSSRVPNKQTRVEQMNQSLQVMMPVAQQILVAGIVQPYNALVSDWARANDFDATPYLVQAPPAPQQQGK